MICFQRIVLHDLPLRHKLTVGKCIPHSPPLALIQTGADNNGDEDCGARQTHGAVPSGPLSNKARAAARIETRRSRPCRRTGSRSLGRRRRRRRGGQVRVIGAACRLFDIMEEGVLLVPAPARGQGGGWQLVCVCARARVYVCAR